MHYIYIFKNKTTNRYDKCYIDKVFKKKEEKEKGKCYEDVEY